MTMNLDLGQYHWHQRWEVSPGVFTPGHNDVGELLRQVGLPRDLSGKRVLDIGAWNGCFSFECERRGAREVVGIGPEPAANTGLEMLRRYLGSSVRYELGSIYDLDPAVLGHFDIVLCFGVLYHLRYPLLGLDNIRRVCTERLFLETSCIDNGLIVDRQVERLTESDPRLDKLALLQFYRNDEFNKDPSNWFSPNVEAIREMLASAGFPPEHVAQWGARAVARSRVIPGLPEFLTIGAGEGVYYNVITQRLLGDIRNLDRPSPGVSIDPASTNNRKVGLEHRGDSAPVGSVTSRPLFPQAAECPPTPGESRVTREQVIWCYEMFLGRQPESEEVIKQHIANHNDQRALVWGFLASGEFQRRNVPHPLVSDFTYSDQPSVQQDVIQILRRLEPYKVQNFEKVRVGRDFDGGYVMLDDFKGLSVAYSLGINDDVSWDRDIAERGIDVFQYDHTIPHLPAHHPRFKWFKKGVAANRGSEFESLYVLLRENGHAARDDLLLKCDIEGAEWGVLATIDPLYLQSFRQIVIEMHGFQMLDRSDFCETARKAVEALTKYHRVVHVHANNNSAYSIVGGIPVPASLEFTLVRVDGKILVPNDETFPTALDMPCWPHRADYRLGLFRF